MSNMTLERSTQILNGTSGACAIQVLHYDEVETRGSAWPKEFTNDIREALVTVNHELKSPVLTEDQFKSASYEVEKHGLIQRSRPDGHLAIATRSEADARFRQHQNFGANSIAEFKEALYFMIDVVLNEDNESTLLTDATNDPVDEIIAISTEECNDDSELSMYERIKAELKEELEAELTAKLTVELTEKITRDVKRELGVAVTMSVDELVNQLNGAK